MANRSSSPRNSGDDNSAVAEVMPEKMLRDANKEPGTSSELAVLNASALSWDDDALLSIASFDDALALLAEHDTPVVDASQVIGNGFAVLNDKAILQGVRFVALSWKFNGGAHGVFASVYVVAQMPGMNVPAKFVLNDGSTGICQQLMAYSKKTGNMGGLLVKNGLRRSDYTYTDPTTNEEKNATTFYLDTSA